MFVSGNMVLMAVRWEATDQFGNLYVGNSDATSMDELHADLESMVAEVSQRKSADVRFSIDLEYGEISAPEGGQVSHLMNVSWLSDRVSAGEPAEVVFHDVRATLENILSEHAGIDAQVQGPWDA